MRPVGWRYESVRHSLAAKGIRSVGYFFRIARGSELGRQVHAYRYGEEDDFGERIKRIGAYPRGGFVKPEPRSVLWTSTFRPGRENRQSDWIAWTLAEHPSWLPSRIVEVVPNPGARILQIRSKEDKERFLNAFGGPGLDVDWSDVADKFDAVQMTSSAGRLGDPGAWDAEGTVWLNRGGIRSWKGADLLMSDAARKIKELSELKEIKSKEEDALFGRYAKMFGANERAMDAMRGSLQYKLIDAKRRDLERQIDDIREAEHLYEGKRIVWDAKSLPEGWFARKAEARKTDVFMARKPSASPEELRRWRENVNMSARELSTFMEKYGDVAGLSRKEASAEGIKSGRDSARAIIRMKQKPVKEWNAGDVAWMRRQNSFVARMRGAKGPLYDDKGRPTRKLLALKVWGHDPEK